MTISEWLIWAGDKLAAEGITSAQLDVRIILEFNLGKSREWVFGHPEHKLSKLELDNLNKYIARRLTHEPIACLTGEKEFYGRSFNITKDVLIPRPESESIIELLAQLIVDVSDNANLLDVGTGSGCLAITAKLEHPRLHVFGVDISDSALKIAESNARSYNADIKFSKSDLLNNVLGVQFTIIIANLPYVPDGMITSDEILKEPRIALFSGKDGLDLYSQFWTQVKNLDYQPSLVLTESLISQHPSMENLAKKASYKLLKTKELIQVYKPV